jgi:hypothetical protein
MTMIAAAYQNSSEENTFSHTEHCFDYLRQAILCAADITLERVRVDGSIDIGSPRVCKDWSRVRSMIDTNHEQMTDVMRL